MTDDTKFTAVREFIAKQRAAGRYNAATARNLETACAIIAPLLASNEDTIGFVSTNLDDLVRRHANLNPHVGQGSVDTYRSRIRRAIKDYIGHRTDPQWRPPSRQRRQTPTPVATDETSSPSILPTRNIPERAPEIALPTESAPRSMRHRLPLRADFDVEILLPRDFSPKEAKRVTNWITALVLDSDEDVAS
jgi:hypothetical protein